MAKEKAQIYMLCSSNSVYFAEALGNVLRRGGINFETLHIKRGLAHDGESVLQFIIDPSELSGKDCIYVSSLIDDTDFLDLMKIGAALSSYGTRSRIFIIPFLGYSTMERAVKPGEVVTCKANIRLLSRLPAFGYGNSFLLLDLHVSGILHYFEGAVLRTELTAFDSFVKVLKASWGVNDKLMFASADLGRPKYIESLAKEFKTDIAFVRKTRDHIVTKVQEVIGSVEGKHVIIYDDMTRSGGTLISAANAYKEKKALSVSAMLSHLALNDESVIEKLINSDIKHIITTNSHPFVKHPALQQYITKECPSFKLPDPFIDSFNSNLSLTTGNWAQSTGGGGDDKNVRLNSPSPLSSSGSSAFFSPTPLVQSSCTLSQASLTEKKFYIIDISNKFAKAIVNILNQRNIPRHVDFSPLLKANRSLEDEENINDNNSQVFISNYVSKKKI